MPEYPPSDFDRGDLILTTVGSGTIFHRIYFARYPDPLGYGKTPSRFSDPRRRVENNRFGVLYLGETVAVCFLEAVLRDQRNGVIGNYPISERELRERQCAQIEVVRPLRLVELRGNSLITMGVPTDVPRWSRHTLSRRWSVAFHEHPDAPDGIVYPSRLNGHTNLAIYDRAIIPNLRVQNTTPLIERSELPRVLDDFRVALV